MEKLSKNFTLEELTASVTAKKKGIDNTPSKEVKENLRILCRKILQPLRDLYGKPIRVGSGYRCPALNTAVGGVKNSDHMHGCAADITSMEDDFQHNAELFGFAVYAMRMGIITDVKQIIDEYNMNWIHISFQDGRTAKRNQITFIRK